MKRGFAYHYHLLLSILLIVKNENNMITYEMINNANISKDLKSWVCAQYSSLERECDLVDFCAILNDCACVKDDDLLELWQSDVRFRELTFFYMVQEKYTSIHLLKSEVSDIPTLKHMISIVVDAYGTSNGTDIPNSVYMDIIEIYNEHAHCPLYNPLLLWIESNVTEKEVAFLSSSLSNDELNGIVKKLLGGVSFVEKLVYFPELVTRQDIAGNINMSLIPSVEFISTINTDCVHEYFHESTKREYDSVVHGYISAKVDGSPENLSYTDMDLIFRIEDYHALSTRVLSGLKRAKLTEEYEHVFMLNDSHRSKIIRSIRKGECDNTVSWKHVSWFLFASIVLVGTVYIIVT